jgi:L-amino acid dehydrogenase
MKNRNDDKDETAVNGRRGLDRRQFGKALAAGVGGLTVGAVAGAQETSPSTPQRTSTAASPADGCDYDVVIVGAGLSGLIAARELKRAQKNVLVVEANCRIGGRMYRQETKIPGTYVDLGGQWVGETQYEMKALAAELGIKPYLSYEEGLSVLSYKGKRTRFNGDVATLLEGRCGPDDLPDHAKCLTSTLGDCAENLPERKVWEELIRISKTVPPDRPWAAEDAAAMDYMPFGTWLRDAPAKLVPNTAYDPWLPTLQSRIGGAGGFEPRSVSLLHMAWTQRVGPQSETPEKWLLCGGAGQIPQKLADEIGMDRIRMNTVVSVIEQQNGCVVVTDKTNHTYKARAVIVAIPPSLRKKIVFKTFEPGGKLPWEYEKFSAGSIMGSMSKVHAIYDRPFWRDECLSGSSAGDLATCQFVADSSSPGGPGILTSFIAAGRNNYLTKCYEGLGYSPDQIRCAIRELVLKDFVSYFGRNLEKDLRNYKDFLYFNWNEQTYTGGAFTNYLKPETWTTSGEVGWRTPVGDIYWAGTETADRWPGYFDGAVRAGKAAASAILVKWFEAQEGSCPSSASGLAKTCTPAASFADACKPLSEKPWECGEPML